MLCIKLHTSAFATRREAIRWWFHISLLHRFSKPSSSHLVIVVVVFERNVYGLKALRFFTASLYAFHGFGYMGLQEIKWDGYNQTNVTTWVQIVEVVVVHLAINFIHKGRHQQKNTKHEYSKKSFAGSTNQNNNT